MFEVENIVYIMPESKYHGIVGTLIAINDRWNLVRFNGIQQFYFSDKDLKIYKKNRA